MSRLEIVQSELATEIKSILVAADGRVVVPEAQLLFNAQFERSGSDLFLVNEGHTTFHIADYFTAQQPADIYSPDGAVLRGDLVARMAGPIAPAQYAQAGQQTGTGPIGQVETLSGGAVVQHTDGSVETLQVGMKIFQNDVIQTESDGVMSVTFVDGTIFTLAAGSRMVIDELIFDPEGSANSGSFSLIQGGFVFIAGQVAKTGDMEVNTPSATMGIRGTTVLVDIQMDNGVVTSEVTLTRDPDGGIGEVVLRDTNGVVIANITDSNTKWVISTVDGETREETRSALDDAQDSVLIAEAFSAYQSAFSRVENGDTFVTLGDPSNYSSPGSPSDPGGTDLELDSIDDPDNIDPDDPDGPLEQKDDSGIFEEGRLNGDNEINAVDVAFSGFEDAAISGAISGVIQQNGFGNSVAVFELGTGPGNGSVVVASDGSFNYVPDANFNGIDSFTYNVVDSDGIVEAGTVTIKVSSVNDAPQLANSTTSVTEDGVVSGAVVGTDVDGDNLQYKLETGAANGQVVLLQSGAFTYTPNPDFNGADSFLVTVSDPSGASSVAAVNITVSGINDRPVIVSAPDEATGSVVEDSVANSVSGTLSATDADIGAVLTWGGSQQGVFGSFEISENGTWVYTLDGTAADTLSANQIAADVFTATVTDDQGATTDLQVTVTIDGTNDTPTITTPTGAESGSVTEGSEVTSVSGKLSASDPDSGTTLTWSGSALGIYGAFTLAADGSWTYLLDNSAADVLSEGQITTETFAVTVTDDLGATADQNVVVSIMGTNDVPVVKHQIIVEVTQNETYEGALTATDVDSTGLLAFATEGAGPLHGLVAIDPDGTYIFTPDAGFQGLDAFEYSVTDSDGGIRVGLVTVEVESEAGTGADGQVVSLNINTEPTLDAPAGSVTITASPADATSINLVIVMDRSGSIGSNGWATQTKAVADALEKLAEQFSSSNTNVDVKIITYATNVQVLDTMDLQDPTLNTTVRDLPFTGGSTNWSLALNETENFLDTQPAGDSNFLFFITDGNPTSGDWQTALTELTDVSANGYTVNIEAFGIGSGYNQATLSLIDPTPTLLETADDLAQALTDTPIFNPQLIGFDLSLIVDGVDLGTVADETSSIFVNDGLNYELSLAEIVDIETLLGENNRFSATVRFDLDGDASTAEIELFSTELISVSETAQVLPGMDESDLLLGSVLNDQISGNGGNDVILGFAGDDVLNGGSGANVLLGGDGDDILVVSETPSAGDSVTDGGNGRDVLAIEFAGNIDSDLFSALSVSDIEAIDIENGLTNTLDLTLADVIDLSSTADANLETLLGEALPESAVIYGDAGDTLVLSNGPDGEFSQVSGDPIVDESGHSLVIFQYVEGGNILATLGVDDDVMVTTLPVA